MAIESFTFDKGINIKKSSLFLSDGEMVSCNGLVFLYDGELRSRPSQVILKTIDTLSTSKINGMYRGLDSIYASSRAYCPGNQSFFNYIYRRTLGGSYAHVDPQIPISGNNRPRFEDYDDFVFTIDGVGKKAFIDGNAYEWGIPNPETAPQLNLGGTGEPSIGTYSCYFTYWVQFPNEKSVETGPSPVGTITLSSKKKIEWSGITSCPYQGNGVKIHRKLYRTVSGVPYLVTELLDNTTNSYEDDLTDAVLQSSPILSTDLYTTPPKSPTDLAIYLQRIFMIMDNKLYWTEPYSPFSCLTTSNIVISKDKENLIGIINWGDQLWIPTEKEWYRLQGNDPTTWAIKRTFTDNGVINRDTIKKSRFGIIGLWTDGIYLFDGSLTVNLTLKHIGENFFEGLDLSLCYAEFDGIKYSLYYASTGAVIDSCLIIDFTYYPEFRVYHDNFIPDVIYVYKNTGASYRAKGGYEYEEGGSEIIPTYLQSGDRAFQALIKRKCLDYLYYDINTGGKDVPVEILIDGIVGQTLTLNTSSRIRKRSDKLQSLEGYRFALNISCADSKNLIIYAPWVLEATLVGT